VSDHESREVVIRPAHPGDAESIAAIHEHAWETAYRPLLPPDVLDRFHAVPRADRWRDRLAGMPTAVHGLVAVSRDEPVAYAVGGPVRDEPDEIAEVYNLYVDPDAWRGGIGRDLQAALLAALDRDGYARAILWVLGTNEGAQSFYRATGWSHDGVGKESRVHGYPVRLERYSRSTSRASP
jgi:ribosomal protein S18 acetylase RimI-like enzyme